MHIYFDSESEKRKPVHGWNTVDALVDGRLQHGMVIDAVEDGLIINFECSQQRGRFVEYGLIFDCSDAVKSEEHIIACCMDSGLAATADVQALIRSHPDRPWIWYPAQFLPFQWAHDNWQSGYVEVELENDIVRELLPAAQIRARFSLCDLAARAIAKGHFVTRSCRVPDSYWSTITPVLSDALCRGLENRDKVFCTHVAGEGLIYVQRCTDYPLTPESLERTYQSRSAYIAYSQSSNSQWIRRQVEKLKPPKKRQTRRKPITKKPLSLPAELLTEVFHSLNTVNRTRCRRTCRTWNAILTADGYFTDI
ncbi:uncharacterized protein LOC129585592 [Paramacrobiotus metropolitanus]|uniref:uncharacterized protein LOC129585592 n=1 Tax=Paramacrobiotus metropolitanus TaxID=2943436 RepID=UPI0024464B4A|nr:uncharacterized protein LOC129585592 [Paramacrobiotus metropolitanus]